MTKPATRTIKIPRKQYREFAIDLEERQEGGDGTPARYPLSFSSETPVVRYSWTIGKYREILSHEPADVDLSRAANGLPLFKSHISVFHIGSVSDIALKGKRGRGVATFSSIPLGQEQETLLREGHLSTVSVGYEITGMDLVTKDKEGIPTYRVKWKPMEISTTPLPADEKVGFGRSATDEDLVEFTVEELTKEERAMPPEEPTPSPTTPPTPAPAPVRTDEPPQRNRNKEIADILALCDTHKVPAEQARAWIAEDLTPQQVAPKILEIVRGRSVPFTPPAAEQLPGKEKDLRNYSYARALQQALNLREAKPVTGLEGEVHQELAREMPASYSSHNGILIPMRLKKRALDTLTAGAGAELVQTGAGDMIEMLRTRTGVLRMGARLLTGLTAPIAFPKQTGGMTVYWVGENPAAAVPESQLSTGLALLSPKQVMGKGVVSRQLITQASVDTEGMVETELGAAHSRGVDRAAIHGTGAAGQPTGIYYAADVQPKAMGGAATFGKLVDMQGLMASADADMGQMGYLGNPLWAASMKQTLQDSVAGAGYIWTGRFDNGEVAGYPAFATNQVLRTLGAGSNEYGLVFGNWNDLIIGLWNSMEVTVDPYTLADYAMVKITSFQMADVMLRHGQSFVKATGLTL